MKTAPREKPEWFRELTRGSQSDRLHWSARLKRFRKVPESESEKKSAKGTWRGKRKRLHWFRRRNSSGSAQRIEKIEWFQRWKKSSERGLTARNESSRLTMRRQPERCQSPTGSLTTELRLRVQRTLQEQYVCPLAQGDGIETYSSQDVETIEKLCPRSVKWATM